MIQREFSAYWEQFVACQWFNQIEYRCGGAECWLHKPRFINYIYRTLQ